MKLLALASVIAIVSAVNLKQHQDQFLSVQTSVSSSASFEDASSQNHELFTSQASPQTSEQQTSSDYWHNHKRQEKENHQIFSQFLSTQQSWGSDAQSQTPLAKKSAWLHHQKPVLHRMKANHQLFTKSPSSKQSSEQSRLESQASSVASSQKQWWKFWHEKQAI